MNYRTKFIVLLFTVFMAMSKAYSQDPTDPGIVTLMSPSSLVLGSTGVLSADVGNYGTETIAANSLRVTISVGLDAKILGIAPGSDSRWTQLGLLTNVSGNTILLTNSGGGFAASDHGNILISVQGAAISPPDIIQSNIVYITAANPLLCQVPNCNPAPLNASQGNASTSNDNHQTSLEVTAPASIDAMDDIALGPVNGVTGGTAFTNVLGNDLLNNAPVAPAQVSVTYVSSTNAGITLNGTNVIVAAGTPAGSYSLVYRICDISNPGNCDQATVSVTVCGQIAAPIVSVIQPTCSVPTGTITVTAGSGLSYSINGNSYGGSVTFADLAPNSYNVTVKNSGGCVSDIRVATVNPRPADCSNTAGIFHTDVSCSDYRNDTGSKVGQLCYTTKSNKVFNVTPGQFFYYSTVTAPSADFYVDVEQKKLCNGLTLFGINQNNQISLNNANCTIVARGKQISLGLGQVHIVNATPGAQYVLAVKYDSKTLIGSTFSGPAAVCQYTFETKINGQTVASSSIDLVPNCSATTAKADETTDKSAVLDWDVTLAPNPSSSDFGLDIKTDSGETITVRIMDMQERLIRQFKATPQDVIRCGSELSRGLYFIEVIQGDKRTVLKAEKI